MLGRIKRRFFLMDDAQLSRFKLYYPSKTCSTERNIALLVAILQLCMIITAIVSPKPVFRSFRSGAYFLLYVSLFIATCPVVALYTQAIRSQNYKWFFIVRRIYSVTVCLWIIGITFVELVGGKSVTVFCYFMPCAAAVSLVFPHENAVLFGGTWLGMTIMMWGVSGNSEAFFSSFVNVTMVSVLAVFIAYRYYQSLAKEFCDRETIDAQYRVIELKNEQLQQMINIDQLTGLYNRRYLSDGVKAQYAVGAPRPRQCIVLMLDIDYFKKYNDSYGHLHGDECLRRVAAVLQASADKHGAAAIRYGGEEFLFIKADDSLENPQLLAAELQQGLAEASITRSDVDEGRVTVSIGMWYTGVSEVADFEDAIRCADKALYKAKETGRNKLVIFSQQLLE